MLAVATELEALAGALEMTRSTIGDTIDLARIAVALELPHARRLHRCLDRCQARPDRNQTLH
jgi:hypothetical protein